MHFCCFICNLKLSSVFIHCMGCTQSKNSRICLNCFSSGLEKASHENNHPYKVINMDEMITIDGWSVQQELDLIEQIESTNDVFFLNTLTDPLTLSHLEKWQRYFAVQTDYNEEFERFLNDFYSVKTSHRINMFKRVEIEQSANRSIPIRPQELSNLYKKMNGYRAARGDFETEMNDKYELKIAAEINPTDASQEEHDEDVQIESELVSALVDSYQDLISERYERKKFIKKFGLLNDCYNSNQLLMSKYGEQVVKYDGENRLKTENVIKLQKFFESYEEYIKFLEVYNHQSFLVKRIDELEGYRQMGIKSLKHVEPYRLIKMKRLNQTPSVYLSSLMNSLNRNYDSSSRKLMNNENLKEWFKQMCISEKALPNEANKTLIPYQAQSFVKHKNNPLKIENYPDYDKLNEDEREFCRVSRIQPAVFLKVKTILITENQKSGQCSYSRARKIAGIDVNKTRVIHSFMISNKLIRA